MEESLKYELYKKEVIDGTIYYMAPAPPSHSLVIFELGLKFGNYFKIKHKQCKVATEGMAIFLDDQDSYVQPDLAVLCDKSKFTKKGYEGVPKLVIEVLSKSTMKYDKNEKFKKYEKSGVIEYWIVDLNNKSIEQYILIDEKYCLEYTAILMDDWEIESLIQRDREQYSTIIRSKVFDDLEIDLRDIFGFELDYNF